MKKRIRYCKLPSPMNVGGRSSSIAGMPFINAIIPIVAPTEAEELEDHLRILAMDPSDIRCAYCGDKEDRVGPFSANYS